MFQLSFLLCLSTIFLNNLASDAQLHWKVPGKEASVHFTMPIDQDALYKEYIHFSTDQDKLTIVNWSTTDDALPAYDPIFKENKKVYTNDVTFKVDIALKEPIAQASLRFTYYLKSKGCIQEQFIHLPLVTELQPASAVPICIDVPEVTVQEASEQPYQAPTIEYDPSVSWSCTVSHMIKHTNSIWLQCLLILLLGALLSLTPCIYPMIPITVGILQGQGSTSFWKNLLISCCYTTGIATTFSLLGLTAAYTGKLFGTFMQHPIVIIAIVLLLLYLAGSMFGFYEMYTPRMFTMQTRFTQGGSPLAAFLFGALSGTVASPCVSPGLALILSIVAGLANPLIGFLFLFIFGIGLSIPLLIIGTFSGSLQLLPKAGSWMVEIKKVFGFLLIGMSIYFLKIIIPAAVSAWLFAATLCIAGIYYLRARSASSLVRIAYQCVGIGLVASSIIMGYYALRTTLHAEQCSKVGLWTYDYACARAKAQHEQKQLLIKVEAPCCSMCTAIDKKFFQNDQVIDVLDQQYVPVIIDGSDDDAQTKQLVQKFKIIGFPTILIVDPQTEQITQQWASDLYNYTVDEFINALK